MAKKTAKKEPELRTYLRREAVKLVAGTAGTAKTRLLEALTAYEREHGQLSETELRDMLPPRPTCGPPDRQPPPLPAPADSMTRTFRSS